MVALVEVTYSFQIESALKEILIELKKLPTCEMSNSKSSSSSDEAGCSSMDMSLSSNGAGDVISDIYTVIEGSVLVPFIEVSLEGKNAHIIVIRLTHTYHN